MDKKKEEACERAGLDRAVVPIGGTNENRRYLRGSREREGRAGLERIGCPRRERALRRFGMNLVLRNCPGVLSYYDFPLLNLADHLRRALILNGRKRNHAKDG
jgi:hypothetical protein